MIKQCSPDSLYMIESTKVGPKICEVFEKELGVTKKDHNKEIQYKK